jgi:hypothetical protein
LQCSVEPGAANGKELLEALLSFDQKLAGARSRSKAAKATLDQAEDVGRPRLLDDAAARLAEARVCDAEPVPAIARSIGVTARKLRRARHGGSTSGQHHKVSS